MTEKEMGKLFAFLTALYPNIKIKDGTLEAWYEVIGDLDAGVAKAAFVEVLSMQHIPCMPAVGAVRESAARMMGNVPPLPADAWALVREAIRRDMPAERLHPAIQRAVRGMGGLDAIGYAEVSIGVLQTQFMRLYEPLAHSEQTRAQLPESMREFIAGVEIKQITG
ncbi:MAG: hypothetical protein RQM92_09765 [Candidatus Syntrophopropionicum ammoniitolerans]